MTISKVYIDDSEGIKGVDIEFIKEKLFDLEPGVFVTQIGDGRNNGSYRTDNFVQPFQYVGSLKIDMDGEMAKVYCFQVPPEMIPTLSEQAYLLYESTEFEILRRDKKYMRWMVPIFKTVPINEGRLSAQQHESEHLNK